MSSESAGAAVASAANSNNKQEWQALLQSSSSSTATTVNAASQSSSSSPSHPLYSPLSLHSMLLDLHALSKERSLFLSASVRWQGEIERLQSALAEALQQQHSMQRKIQILEFGLKGKLHGNGCYMCWNICVDGRLIVAPLSAADAADAAAQSNANTMLHYALS